MGAKALPIRPSRPWGAPTKHGLALPEPRSAEAIAPMGRSYATRAGSGGQRGGVAGRGVGLFRKADLFPG